MSTFSASRSSGDLPGDPARRVVAELTRRGQTVATAESLTAGLVASALAEVPGASAVLRGGVVSYDNSVKAGLLGVPEDLLAERGSVDPDVARAMAAGTRQACGSDWGLSTTGVAGPAAHDGQPVGRVYVGLVGPENTQVRELDLSGDREAIRRASVDAVLGLLLDRLDGLD